jgi:hypothetical protein
MNEQHEPKTTWDAYQFFEGSKPVTASLETPTAGDGVLTQEERQKIRESFNYWMRNNMIPTWAFTFANRLLSKLDRVEYEREEWKELAQRNARGIKALEENLEDANRQLSDLTKANTNIIRGFVQWSTEATNLLRRCEAVIPSQPTLWSDLKAFIAKLDEQNRKPVQ